MQRFGFAIVCVLLASCSGGSRSPESSHLPALEITADVHAGYEKYQQQMNSGGGLFAVTIDGSNPFSQFCSQQDECAPSSQFLESCAAHFSQPCRLIAVGRDEKIQPLVVPIGERLTDDSLLLHRAMKESDIRQKIVGSTLSGEYLNKLNWREYYSPDGEIIGRDDIMGDYKARYEIRGHKLCFVYESLATNWCASITLLGDKVFFVNEDRYVVHTIRNTRILPGKALTSP